MKGLRLVWYRLWQQVARVLFVLVFGLRVHHRRRFPRTGGVLVVANHQSYLDPILAAVGMPRAFHPMARESLFRFAPFRWLIGSLYAFPVRRGTADLAAVKEALRRLKAGGVVLMFPEGTRTRDGSIGPMHGGPAAIAVRAGVPLVPMVIDGAFEAWPRTRRLPRPQRIRVACGRAVSVGDSGADAPERVMAAVHRQMVGLQAELRQKRRPQ
ncbi:MAG: lysophospholipid acyltransferase family protein [Phycisphaerae bacterium]